MDDLRTIGSGTGLGVGSWLFDNLQR